MGTQIREDKEHSIQPDVTHNCIKNGNERARTKDKKGANPTRRYWSPWQDRRELRTQMKHPVMPNSRAKPPLDLGRRAEAVAVAGSEAVAVAVAGSGAVADPREEDLRVVLGLLGSRISLARATNFGLDGVVLGFKS